MSNIREIEVNGTKYGIESVNDIRVSYSEPADEIKPTIWIKPSGVYEIQGTIGIEYKTGSTSSYGDYTLDDEGNLIETTDETNATGTRCTKLFGLFKDHAYSLKMQQGSGTVSTGKLFTWEVYFYDINKQFISKSTGTIAEGETYSQGQSVIDFVMPEGARFIRIKFPYSKSYYCCLVDGDSDVQFTGGGKYGLSYSDKFYEFDGDHYVQI